MQLHKGNWFSRWLTFHIGFVCRHPVMVLLVSISVVALFSSRLPSLRVNSNVNAFLPSGDPVLIYQKEIQDQFAIGDGMQILVQRKAPDDNGIYHPDAMRALVTLGDSLKDIDGIDPSSITSLATEYDIRDTGEGFDVRPFLPRFGSFTSDFTDKLRQRVRDFPFYRKMLVSDDETSTLIVVEAVDSDQAGLIYHEVMEQVERLRIAYPDLAIHVAGESAVNATLGKHINSDMGRLNVLCALMIACILTFAFRDWRGVLYPLLVVGGMMSVVIGIMSMLGEPFYAITNALPVILVAIGVADSIHLMGEFLSLRHHDSKSSLQKVILDSVFRVVRPLTITTLTDAAGFLCLGFASDMPPMRAFGVYAAIGSAVGWVLSITFIPACLAISPPNRNADCLSKDVFGKWVAWLFSKSGARHRAVYVLFLLIGLMAVGFASNVRLDEERIRNFKDSEAIAMADRSIQDSMLGASRLCLIVDTGEQGGMLAPACLNGLRSLQNFLGEQPEVASVGSVLDIISRVRSVLEMDEETDFSLPDSADDAAQYLLLYALASSPDALRRWTDSERRYGIVQIMLHSGQYSVQQQLIHRLSAHLDSWGSEMGVEWKLSGRAAVDVHWMGKLVKNHFLGVFLAITAVFCILWILFSSFKMGILATIPVLFSILAMYGVMGGLGIWLNVGTSMFAAIAIGTGVDFSVYVVDFLKAGESESRSFAATGRSLVFNFSCVFLGFGLLMTSVIPPLISFGILITMSILISFLASLILLPALLSKK